VFEAKMGKLLGVVGEVETAADEVLAIEERERVAGINEVIDGYIKKFQELYGLDEDHLSRIERKKCYYNKTADEKVRKDDIELQFKDLKKEQDTYAANIRLIQAACKDEQRINVQHWIKKMRYEDVASIIEAVTAEKQRLQELDKQEQETAVTQTASSAVVENIDCGVSAEEDTENEKVIIGIPNYIDFTSDFKGRKKVMAVELTYPCDLGDALTLLFEQLKTYGIKVRAVKPSPKKEEYAF
jgi:hypothetical protein